MATENNTTHTASGEFLGKDLEFLNQTFPSSVAAKTAKDSTIDVVEKTIQIYANIVGASPLVNSNVEKTTSLKARTNSLVHRHQRVVLSH